MHYKNNFITHVIFRIDFPKILGLSKANPPAEFQGKIIRFFPQLNEQITRSVSIGIKRSSTVTQQEDMPQWEFLDRERTEKIIVNPVSFVQEFLRYNKFNEYFTILKETLGHFLSIYEMPICNRIGLRYINDIRIDSGDPLNWENMLFTPLYEGNLQLGLTPNTLKRSMHSLESKEGDYNLSFNYGIFNSEYPNPVARKEFILDYDCYYDEELETAMIFDTVKEFNAIITEWFEKSISDGLRSIMGGQGND